MLDLDTPTAAGISDKVTKNKKQPRFYYFEHKGPDS